MNRIAIVASILALGWSAAGAAEEPHGLLDDLRACMQEQDDARRLSCYDEMASAHQPADAKPGRLAAPAPAAASTAAAPAVTAASAVAAKAPPPAAPAVTGSVGPQVAAADAEERFGFRGNVARADLDRQHAAAARIERLTAKVTKIATLPRGQLVVTLDNGQVWQQKRRDSHVRLKVGDQVTIRAGTLGSFWLNGPTGSATSVNRIQ